jgi:hypothetical protein
MAILVFVTSLHHAAVAQSADSSSLSQRELVRQIRRLGAAQEMVNMPSVAPLFIEDAQFSSTLYVVNEGNAPVKGRLLLLGNDGRLILDKTVSVSGHDQAALSIQALLAEAGSTVTRAALSSSTITCGVRRSPGKLSLRSMGGQPTSTSTKNSSCPQ